MKEWYKEFIDLYFKSNILEAYKFKHKNIPSKLFKFQPYKEDRISSIINNKIWFTIPKDLNDPFDSRGVYWNTEDLQKIFVSRNKYLKLEKVNQIVTDAVASLRNNIKITCFSEDLFSMPMWSHYADNHKGFCVEYNFKQLDYENDFTKYLFPVGYESQRYNITNLTKLILENQTDLRINLFFFLMSLKHKSWAYENEWRIIKMRLSDVEFKSGLEDCPVKPTAIYLGVNFDENEVQTILEKFINMEIPIYRLKVGNSKFFDLDLIKIN